MTTTKNNINTLTLKWGTLKAWNFPSESGKKLLKEDSDLGMSFGAAQQNDTPRQKEIICELVDICDDPEGVYLDWDGKYVSKEEAKDYLREYDK